MVAELESGDQLLRLCKFVGRADTVRYLVLQHGILVQTSHDEDHKIMLDHSDHILDEVLIAGLITDMQDYFSVGASGSSSLNEYRREAILQGDPNEVIERIRGTIPDADGFNFRPSKH